ncbi:hypothetical protein FA95DRAFT_707078 [Auriscalpium vulgare]|uniref:Uncharacterized protein n=1 Tax=Auriscalpium vulgare TaxID=40419 RepID=A0ACB8S235_9AGAM|nr:hypothetical protein FA95DRAFT_707078 [Auriscalpium vulgare]
MKRDSSPPTKVMSSITKPKVAGMKAKDGKLAPAGKPTREEAKTSKAGKTSRSKPENKVPPAGKAKPEAQPKTPAVDHHTPAANGGPAPTPPSPVPAVLEARSKTPVSSKPRHVETPIPDAEDEVDQFSSPPKPADREGGKVKKVRERLRLRDATDIALSASIAGCGGKEEI